MASTPLDWMKKKTPAALSMFLQRKGLDKSIAERLLKEEISGLLYLDVDAKFLRDCGFKGGEILQILRHVPKPDTEHSDTESNNADSDSDRDNSDLAKDDSDFNLYNLSQLDSFRRNSSDEESDNSDKENQYDTSDWSMLSAYMDLSQLSVYEKKRNLKLLLRWKESVAKGHDHANIIKPSFVSEWEKAEATKRQAKQKSTVSDVNPASHKAGSKQPFRTSSGNNSSGPSVQSGATASLPSSLAAPSTLKQSERVLNSTPCSSAQSAISRIRRVRKDVVLPSYDVKNILETIKEDAEAEAESVGVKINNVVKIIDSLFDGSLLSEKDRKHIFRVLINYLHFEIAFDPTSVTTKMKEGLAKSFVEQFPQYKSELQEKAWGAIYDGASNTGFFANCSRSIQKKHRVRKTKRVKIEDSSAGGSEEELSTEALQLLNVMMPGRAEKPEILDSMAKSFKTREKYRQEQRTIHDFLTDFCHFTHYDGEVIREEFRRMYPQAEDLAINLQKKLGNILKLNLRKPISLGCEDDVLKAVVIISQHLPHDVGRSGKKTRSTVTPLLKDFFIVVKANDDIQEIINARVCEAGGPVQPYMIVVKALLTNKIIKLFLILDLKWVEIPGGSTIKALQHLVQSYFVFNVDYPLGWRSTFHALATLFLRVVEKGQGITPSEDQLWLRIQ